MATSNNDLSTGLQPIIDYPLYGKETSMAKGQLRSNKEAKKPKQDKKPTPPAGGFQIPARAEKSSNTKS